VAGLIAHVDQLSSDLSSFLGDLAELRAEFIDLLLVGLDERRLLNEVGSRPDRGALGSVAAFLGTPNGLLVVGGRFSVIGLGRERRRSLLPSCGLLEPQPADLVDELGTCTLRERGPELGIGFDRSPEPPKSVRGDSGLPDPWLELFRECEWRPPFLAFAGDVHGELEGRA
jgi:hypothetical protein